MRYLITGRNIELQKIEIGSTGEDREVEKYFSRTRSSCNLSVRRTDRRLGDHTVKEIIIRSEQVSSECMFP
jgi:hypothetical protein